MFVATIHDETYILLNAVPLPPTGFTVSQEYHSNLETTVTLSWDQPGGSGPEAIVDNYTLSISPQPLYQPEINYVHTSPWNVTLAHNVEYNINITAINCAGRSETVRLPTAEIGEFKAQYHTSSMN